MNQYKIKILTFNCGIAIYFYVLCIHNIVMYCLVYLKISVFIRLFTFKNFYSKNIVFELPSISLTVCSKLFGFTGMLHISLSSIINL